MVVNNKVSELVFGVLLVLLAVIGFTPIIRSGLYHLAVALLAALVILRNSQNSCYREYFPLVANVCFYLFIVFSYQLLGVSDVAPVHAFRHGFFFISILLMLLISGKVSDSQRKWVLSIMIIVVLFNIADNIRLCIIHPEFLLKVNRDIDGADMIGEVTNIGGSKFYNALFFFFMVCFFCFLNYRKKIVKYVMLGCAVFTGVFLIAFCLKVSVMVFTVMAAVLLIYAKRTKNTHRFIASLIVSGIFALMFIYLFADIIIDFIASVTSSERVSQRLIMLIDAENEEATAGAGTMNARGRLWMVSIDTWLSNPINFFLGIGDHRAEDQASTGIGLHSELFDLLAKYGIIGFILAMNIIRMSYLYISKMFSKEYKLQILVVFVMLLLFGLTKGIFTTAIGCALFLMLPLSAKYVNA